MNGEIAAEERSSAVAGVDSIRVLTYFGKEANVRQLGEGIRAACIEEIVSAGASGVIEFVEPQVETVEELARALTDAPPDILHIVSHADPKGTLPVEDVWGDLDLTPETLATMLRGKNIRAVVLSTCYGAVIAEMLVKQDAVGLAFGFNQKLNFGAALAVSQGFYRGLALGKGPAEAARESEIWAAARIDRENKKREAQAEALEIEFDPGVLTIEIHESHRDDPLIGQPDFHIISPDTDHYLDIVDTLVEALRPHRVFHIDQARFAGDSVGTAVDESLRHARVIMLLFEGQRIRNQDLLNEVTTAVAQARRRKVRVFPLHLKGNRRDDAGAYVLDVPLGLRGLEPAFLSDRRIKGDYGKLATMLKTLLNKPPRGLR